jgi:hypothetical protein
MKDDRSRLSLLWRRGRQALEKLEETGLLLGLRPNQPPIENESSFEIGDRLLLYTDGFVEAENAGGQSFGEAALPILFKRNKAWEPSNSPTFVNEVLAWSRVMEPSRSRKTMSQCWSWTFTGCGLEPKGNSLFPH